MAHDLPFLSMFRSRIHTMPSVGETENEAIHAALKASDLTKKTRIHVVVHIVKIAVVREIDRIESDTNLVPTPTPEERHVQMKISISLRIEGKESREALPIWYARVILQHVDIGIRKTCMDVNNWTHRERPREMDHSPADHAMGHVRRQDARTVRANHGLLEWKENVRYGIQITARPAPNVRDIQVSVLNRLKMQRGLELVVVRLACREEAQQASTPEHTRNGIHDEQVARLAVDTANANDRVGPQLRSTSILLTKLRGLESGSNRTRDGSAPAPLPTKALR